MSGRSYFKINYIIINQYFFSGLPLIKLIIFPGVESIISMVYRPIRDYGDKEYDVHRLKNQSIKGVLKLNHIFYSLLMRY